METSRYSFLEEFISIETYNSPKSTVSINIEKAIFARMEVSINIEPPFLSKRSFR
jgi:hypothetical protein